jgi:hypothetical protein
MRLTRLRLLSGALLSGALLSGALLSGAFGFGAAQAFPRGHGSRSLPRPVAIAPEGVARAFADELYRSASRTPIPDQTAAAQVAALHAAHAGSTYHLHDGNLDGRDYWSVSPFRGRERQFPGRRLSRAVVAAYLRDNRSVLAGGPYALGTWYAPDQKRTYLDVVLPVRSKEAASRIARHAQQIGIFHLRTHKYVGIGAR